MMELITGKLFVTTISGVKYNLISASFTVGFLGARAKLRRGGVAFSFCGGRLG
jgi:hypothetical protein